MGTVEERGITAVFIRVSRLGCGMLVSIVRIKQCFLRRWSQQRCVVVEDFPPPVYTLTYTSIC
jgi:hypothetical protein